ncbi:MAG: VCBS repeat-containing protein [Bacteroidota bacterium]
MTGTQHLISWLWLGFLLLAVGACQPPIPQNAATHFVKLTPDQSGITFDNRIEESPERNYFRYPYLYLGGGVAAGDLNNDGLPDLFFAGNMVDNQLYLNQGDWTFEEVGKTTGIAGGNRWYTGVSLIDINHDGWLDVYLCVSGDGFNKRNQLFVNQGITGEQAGIALVGFVEEARKWGLDDPGASIQSVFFDYDRDGDLDLYVANYPATPFGSSVPYYQEKMADHPWEESDHLYQNTGNGSFQEVGKAAGIDNFGLSLGISAADFNGDGWDDLYVSNDFSTPDRLFLNQQDGTFQNQLIPATKQTSLFGMGCDAADYNNDGRIDLLQVDMTPQDNRRSKENMASMNPGLFWKMVRSGFHYQYMYNSLQLNRGVDASGQLHFSNACRMAGMSSTDWSWACLFADLDNDGWKDVFITNGIKREVNNRDFINAMKMKINFTQSLDSVSYEDIPSEPVANFAFRNQGDLTFTETGEGWGLADPGFSHGAVYADLDLDGDLDLVTNNMDAPAGVFRNEQAGNHSLRIRLQGPAQNPLGIGARVEIHQQGRLQVQHLSLTRGFQSSVEPILHFGLGETARVDSLHILWPDGQAQRLTAIPGDQLLELAHENAQAPTAEKQPKQTDPLLRERAPELLSFLHQENYYDDYAWEPLLPYQLSRLGPGIAVGDVNGDGREDAFFGNAYGAKGQLLLQQVDGSFLPQAGPWEADSLYEDMDPLLADLDGDGDLDLLVGSGGNEFVEAVGGLEDRFYANVGNGNFVRVSEAIPSAQISSSCVKTVDMDGDGDLDVFLGGRLVPGKYPLNAPSRLLRNEGGTDTAFRLVDVTEDWLPELSEIGRVTDAQWADVNGDGKPDLALTGEWMGIHLFVNQAYHLAAAPFAESLLNQVGWWQSLTTADVDLDGDLDLIAGNLGTNYKYRASPEAPFSVYANDYDGNGKLDIVLGYEQDGEQYPLRGRQCSAEQIPALEMKFKDYQSFANATLAEVYGTNNLARAQQYHATTFASTVFLNEGEAGWQTLPLPSLAQLSSIHDILVQDLNQDGWPDVLVAGNLYQAEVETPRNDASLGLVLLGDGSGHFVPVDAAESGWYLDGDVKSLAWIRRGDSLSILAGLNHGAARIFDCMLTEVR